MIEIKEGWTGLEAANRYTASNMLSAIEILKKQLEAAEWQLNRIQTTCDHRHIKNSMCEVCQKEMS